MDDGEGKRARRVRRDAPETPARRGAGKVKRSFVLTAEVSRRLDAHALGLGVEPARVVADLVDRHCRRFVLTDRGGGSPGPGGVQEGGTSPGAGEGGQEAWR